MPEIRNSHQESFKVLLSLKIVYAIFCFKQVVKLT